MPTLKRTNLQYLIAATKKVFVRPQANSTPNPSVHVQQEADNPETYIPLQHSPDVSLKDNQSINPASETASCVQARPEGAGKPSADDIMELPSYLRENQNVLNMMRVVWDKRANISRQRNTAAHRLELCEGHLQNLRRELLSADRNLAEVERDIIILRNLFVQTSALNGPTEAEELYLSDGDDNSSTKSSA